MKITNIVMRKYFFNEMPLRAIASVVVDDCFVIHDVKVVTVGGRTIIVMPGRSSRGVYRDIAHPINTEFRRYMESEVLDAFYNGLDAAREAAEKREVESETLPGEAADGGPAPENGGDAT